LAFHAFEVISLTTMDHRVFVAAGFTTLVIVYRVYRRYTRISLADVPGPKSASLIMGTSISLYWFCRLLMWLLSGNTKELYQGQAAEADFKWQAQYGNVVRFKALFGVCNDITVGSVQFLIR
jgi:hypothetical protein